VFGLSEAAEEEQDSPPSHTRFPVPGEDSQGQVLQFPGEDPLSRQILQVPPSPQVPKEDFNRQVLQFLGKGPL
jgi:hypothetical protein